MNGVSVKKPQSIHRFKLPPFALLPSTMYHHDSMGITRRFVSLSDKDTSLPAADPAILLSLGEESKIMTWQHAWSSNSWVKIGN
jgi:hypothetical protein